MHKRVVYVNIVSFSNVVVVHFEVTEDARSCIPCFNNGLCLYKFIFDHHGFDRDDRLAKE